MGTNAYTLAEFQGVTSNPVVNGTTAGLVRVTVRAKFGVANATATATGGSVPDGVREPMDSDAGGEDMSAEQTGSYTGDMVRQTGQMLANAALNGIGSRVVGTMRRKPL
jgi:hypothetical protein